MLVPLVVACQDTAYGISAFFERNPTVPIVLIGTLVAFFSLRSQQHLTRAKHTLDFDRFFKESKNKDDLRKALDLLNRRSWLELMTIGKRGDPTDQDFRDLATALNVWEGVAIGIRNGVYNEKMLSDAFGTSVVGVYFQAMPFLVERRAANPRLYENFRWLGIRWAARFSVPVKEAKDLERKEREHAIDLARTEAERESQIRERLLEEIRAGKLTIAPTQAAE